MIFFLTLIYLLVAEAGMVSMALLYFRGKRTVYNRVYLACQAMAVIWCMAQILVFVSRSDWEWRLSYLLGNFGICFIGSCWYYFSVAYTGRTFRRYERLLPMLLSLFHYMAVITNDWHHLYYTVFTREKLVHGVFFYTNVVSVYLLVIAGAVFLFRDFAGRKEARRGRQLILASVLVPVCLNGLYLAGIVRPEFDITPLGFGVSVILVFLATMKYQFLEVNITAFDLVLSGLSDGVAVFDEKGECTYVNEAFLKLMKTEQGEAASDIPDQKNEKCEGELVKGLLNEDSVDDDKISSGYILNMGQVLADMDALECFAKEEDPEIRRNGNGQYIQLQIYQAAAGQRDFREVSAEQREENCRTVLLVRDMSRYVMTLRQERELAVAKEKLSLEQERNRIAQQVHDTAGHTLTMLQSYMKLAMVAEEKGKSDEVASYLAQGRELSADGLRQLRESIRQMKKEDACELVTQGIVQLADQVKEIVVELTVQGEDSKRYSHLSGICYSCAREMITNTLKYAEATKLEIVLRFQEDGLELVMGDDGRGCETIREGNGVRGIRQRAEEAGGSVRFVTAPGEGFLLRMYLPITNTVAKGKGGSPDGHREE